MVTCHTRTTHLLCGYRPIEFERQFGFAKQIEMPNCPLLVNL